MNNRIKINILLSLVLTFFFFIWEGIPSERKGNELQKLKYNYSGTYSLFVESGSELKLNWITNKYDSSHYELSDEANNIISSGKTPNGRVHTTTINQALDQTLTLKFGAINEALSEIKLRPTMPLASSIFEAADSLFVLGDVHGQYDQLIELLQNAKIINEQLDWIAGQSHLVFLGDLFDRGNDVIKVLWFIYELEKEAELAGGLIHVVLGNHEIMTMSNDLRYVGPKEAAIATTYEIRYDKMFHPETSLLGAWLRSKPSVIKIGKAVFAHGGIVSLETNSIEGFNELAYSHMKDPMFLDIMKDEADSIKYDPVAWSDMQYFFYSANSPYWFRGYVLSDTLGPVLNSMLRKYKANVHVVAHTPLETISSLYRGKLLTTDLKEPSTQLLLLVSNKKKYNRYKIDLAGNKSEL